MVRWMDGWMDGVLNLRSIRFSKFLANYRFVLNWMTVYHLVPRYCRLNLFHSLDYCCYILFIFELNK